MYTVVSYFNYRKDQSFRVLEIYLDEDKAIESCYNHAVMKYGEKKCC